MNPDEGKVESQPKAGLAAFPIRVYALYGLTPEEIKIVEGAQK